MAIDEEHQLSDVKTLGLQYAASDDQFTFVPLEVDENQKWTKLNVLSCFMSLYDPLGFVLPYVMMARMLFQDFWRRGLSWKAQIPDEIRTGWHHWRQQLKQLGQIRIDRCIQTPHREKEVIHKHLHIFGDASEAGYGCVAYAVTSYPSGETRSTFIMAKGRVAPVSYTHLTLPTTPYV